ncbi:hypothetical protein SH528x_003123 [Novipirellula sp. SH528]|uniref:hypothetical protein n=1 Tax=Novipirellula sp. SH528 TaxID=3454466 RepID=UPI003FA10485
MKLVAASGLHRLVAPSIILLLFATVLVGVDRLAFRDVGHFYTPLYDYIGHRTRGEWLPLWNPLDQTGIPLVGETTTAVFYPVRWILFLLPIKTDAAVGWYVVIHLILAAITTRYAARRSGASGITATIAGLSYSLSGSVLVLYTNPPFLVGAAWLPLLMSTLIQRGHMPQTRRVLVAGVVMAMMILGGDPQTVANVVIVAIVVAFGRWGLSLIAPRSYVRSEGQTAKKEGVMIAEQSTTIPNVLTAERSTTMIAVLASCLVASILALPQIAASVSWSAQSDRVLRDDDSNWLAPPVPSSRRGQAYQFSVAPWHLAECVTPNAFGSLLPQYRRLSSLIPGDGRIWTPSVYMGLLVAIALLSTVIGIVSRQKTRKRNSDATLWLGITVAATLVCFGHFGVVWLIQNATGTLSQTDSGAGGLYWLLYHFVPGYDSLRYPAKWLPIAAFAASMVTANWLENLPRHASSTRRAIRTLAFVFVIAFVVVVAMQTILKDWIGNPGQLPFDPFWGPLDIAGGLREVAWSIVHSIVALGCIGWVLFRFFGNRLSRTGAARCLLVIVAIDITLFAAGNIARVSSNRDAIRSIPTPVASAGTMTLRTRTGKGWPSDWRTSRDEDRLTEVELSSEIAWFGRWHLANRGHVLNNMTSIRSQAMAMFWKSSSDISSSMSAHERVEFWAAVSQWLGIEQTLNSTEASRLVSELKLVETQIGQTPSHPAIQVHFAWSTHQPSEAGSDDFESLLREVLDGNHLPRVYMDAPTGESSSTDRTDEPNQKWGIKNETADSVEMEIEVSAACLLERTTYQDGHWHAKLVSLDSGETQSATVHRVDYLKQGVLVPAGRCMVIFEYRPWWMIPSIIAAVVAWITALTYWGRKSGWLLRRRGLPSR